MSHRRIDREKTCPFLIRTFLKINEDYKDDDFKVYGNTPEGEIQLYTWYKIKLFYLNRSDATLRELTNLIKEVNETARNSNTSFSYSTVYPSRSGYNKIKELGVVYSTRKGKDDDETLDSLRFHKGDYLIVVLKERKSSRDN